MATSDGIALPPGNLREGLWCRCGHGPDMHWQEPGDDDSCLADCGCAEFRVTLDTRPAIRAAFRHRYSTSVVGFTGTFKSVDGVRSYALRVLVLDAVTGAVILDASSEPHPLPNASEPCLRALGPRIVEALQ